MRAVKVVFDRKQESDNRKLIAFLKGNNYSNLRKMASVDIFVEMEIATDTKRDRMMKESGVTGFPVAVDKKTNHIVVGFGGVKKMLVNLYGQCQQTRKASERKRNDPEVGLEDYLLREALSEKQEDDDEQEKVKRDIAEKQKKYEEEMDRRKGKNKRPTKNSSLEARERLNLSPAVKRPTAQTDHMPKTRVDEIAKSSSSNVDDQRMYASLIADLDDDVDDGDFDMGMR